MGRGVNTKFSIMLTKFSIGCGKFSTRVRPCTAVYTPLNQNHYQNLLENKCWVSPDFSGETLHVVSTLGHYPDTVDHGRVG